MDKTTERIKADAAHYSNKMEAEYSQRSVAAYIAGATTEVERLQPVIDALTQFIVRHEGGLLPDRLTYEKGVKALEEWKGAVKEVEPIKEQLVPTAVYKQVGSKTNTNPTK